jgi:prepilin-type N-terminal cleavage/methylation domain-containing protein
LTGEPTPGPQAETEIEECLVMHKETGFTLIELMIVVAIIAIIAIIAAIAPSPTS